MTAPPEGDDRIAAPSPASAAPPANQMRRFARLALKELREILRDRRTIITLVLMPLMVYPLLSIVSRQFLFGYAQVAGAPEYVVGVTSESDGSVLLSMLRLGRQVLAEERRKESSESVEQDDAGEATQELEPKVFLATNLIESVARGEVDVGVRMHGVDPSKPLDSNADIALNCEILVRDGSPVSQHAAGYVEHLLAAAGRHLLAERLERLGITQRALPIAAARVEVSDAEPSAGLSMLALVPLILILMTITGAVYPAIDLTAGERERGTLEVLVAAPVSRLGLLLAKYTAVVVVASLTATVNMAMMTITLLVSGLGPLLVGDVGLTPLVVLQIFALLLLFAGFFSAVLLALASFARSFKEAQAYLVPLMLVSIAPGLLGVMPNVELNGILAAVPLVNVVLLARDLLAGIATGETAGIVVFSTLLYAMGAVAIAARVFGDESVLYSEDIGWLDALRPGGPRRASATPTGALVCLGLIFSTNFLLANSLVQLRWLPIATRMLLASAGTALVFGGMPLAAAWLAGVDLRRAFRFKRPRPLAWAASIILGLSLWPLAHEVVVLQQKIGVVTISEDQIDRVRQTVDQWRELPVFAVVVAMAVFPAVFEELCFRGYLLSALRSRSTPLAALLGSSVAFGVFHLIGFGGLLTFERFAASTLLGIVLGWVCLRTGSVFPGMVIHAIHNGLLILMAYYQPWLAEQSWSIDVSSTTADLPLSWIVAATAGTVIGGAMIYLATRREAAREPTASH